jgi:hypothetical protein
VHANSSMPMGFMSDANTLASHYYPLDSSIVCHFDFIIYSLCFRFCFGFCRLIDHPR